MFFLGGYYNQPLYEGKLDMKPATSQPPSRRAYPPVYEKFIPVALVVLAVIIVLLIIIALSVVLGFFPALG